MNESQNKKINSFNEGTIKLKNIKLNNLINNNQKELPLISHIKETITTTTSQNLETLSSSTKDKYLINFYKSIHSKNKPLDNFPHNSYDKRFIVLYIETNSISKNSYSNNDKKDELISINAIEVINMELTGIQFHAYFNDDNKNENEIENYQKDITIKNINDNYYYLLSNYFKRRKDNNKKLLEQLLNFIDKSLVICHNALYTIRYINKELKKYNLSEIPINKCICTLRMMRFKNYRQSNEKINGFELNDLYNKYNINIDKNYQNNGLINILALSICITYILQEEKNNNEININNIFENDINNINNSYNENYYENKQKDEIVQSYEFLECNDIEEEQKNLQLNNKNNIFNSPRNNNLYTVIENNKKVFDKKVKIAKSFNKYKLSDKTVNKNMLSFNKINKRNNFLGHNNYTNRNILIKNNIFNENNLFDINNIIKIDNIT